MKTNPYIFLIVLLTGLSACEEDFLEKKPDKSLVVPTTTEDLQALLDNADLMNYGPAIDILGADDYFIPDDDWDGVSSETVKNGYLWAEEVFELPSIADWNIPYERVFYANVVLEELGKIDVTPSNADEVNAIRGRALFYRTKAFYELAQLFCAPYSPGTVQKPGIPLRMTADINAPTVRATVGETYQRMITDLEEAIKYLPEKASVRTRPSRATAHALLAKVYLHMDNYEKAELHADAAMIDPTLIDFNTLDPTSSSPFERLNEEVLIHGRMLSYTALRTSTYIDTVLYASYASDDLRKVVYFRERGENRYSFKGNYTGNIYFFNGISKNEIYLLRAECRVRNGDVPGGLEDLNALLEKRWRTGTFDPITETDPDELLTIIFEEKRKELPYRGIRWEELRRLNRDPRFARTLTRVVKGREYTLPPNDPRYVYPIPLQEILISRIEQNER